MLTEILAAMGVSSILFDGEPYTSRIKCHANGRNDNIMPDSNPPGVKVTLIDHSSENEK